MSDQMPEPLTFNGGPDETGRYVARSTGPRRTRPGICPVCGEDVPDRPDFGNATCGQAACREAMVRR